MDVPVGKEVVYLPLQGWCQASINSDTHIALLLCRLVISNVFNKGTCGGRRPAHVLAQQEQKSERWVIGYSLLALTT